MCYSVLQASAALPSTPRPQAISPVAPSPTPFRCPHAVHRWPSVDSGLGIRDDEVNGCDPASSARIGASGGRGSIQNPPHRSHAAQNRGVYGLRWYPPSE